MYYFYVLALLCTLALGWFLTLLGLPGNWLIVGAAALFAWLVPASAGQGISWTVVGWLAGLAVLAEILECAAGAAGLAKGGSKKGALLAVVGSILGAIVGAGIGLPIPLVGPLFGIIVFAALGAMGGTILGEQWAGKTTERALEIGKIAFWGRLFGSVAKIVIGSVLVAVAAAAAIL